MAKQAEEPTKTVETKEIVIEAKKPVSPLWWVLGTVVVILLLLLLAGAAKRAFVQNQPGFDRFERGGFGMMDGRGGRGHMIDRMNDENSVSGVVTAINGTTLTVAGNGVTKQVTINDSTEYYGAAQPVKVNDSVRIQGTTSGDTFTADQIMISRSPAE